MSESEIVTLDLSSKGKHPLMSELSAAWSHGWPGTIELTRILKAHAITPPSREAWLGRCREALRASPRYDYMAEGEECLDDIIEALSTLPAPAPSREALRERLAPLCVKGSSLNGGHYYIQRRLDVILDALTAGEAGECDGLCETDTCGACWPECRPTRDPLEALAAQVEELWEAMASEQVAKHLKDHAKRIAALERAHAGHEHRVQNMTPDPLAFPYVLTSPPVDPEEAT